MFPCSHTLSECFRTVIFRNFVPCSQKLANVPLFPSIFCQCSLVPQNPWETLAILRFYPDETQHDRPSFAVNESVPKSRPCWAAHTHLGNLGKYSLPPGIPRKPPDKCEYSLYPQTDAEKWLKPPGHQSIIDPSREGGS